MRRTFLVLVLAAAAGGRAYARPPAPAGGKPPIVLSWYISLSSAAALIVGAEFSRRHPGIRLNIQPSYFLFEGGERQRQAWAAADVVTDQRLESRPALSGSGALARLEVPAAMNRALCPRARAPGDDYVYTFAVPLLLLFTRDGLPDGQAPASLAELAQPRWKGKVALRAPHEGLDADCLYRFVAGHPELGFSWLEKMRENDVMLLISGWALATALTRRVRQVAWGIPVHYPSSGLESRPAREGALTMLYATAINARAPHLAAARVFVTWLLEPETQSFMAANGVSLSLLQDGCKRLEKEPICRAANDSPSERKAFSGKVWEALLGDAHISR